MVRATLFQCCGCRRQTSATAGTIFQDTRKPLVMWFRAMWYVTSQKNGVSAMGLQRVLGLGNYETAWTWLHKLRRSKSYQREITKLRGRRKEASQLMPRVHRVAGLLKRWLLGTHQGAVSPRHLPYYLDEFTFRFNRRRSKSRGKLFFRLMQQAVTTPPATYDTLVKRDKTVAQHVGVS
jgi:hypothetical protein